MVVNGRPLKRMKRRVTADLFDFLTFLAIGDGSTVDLDGPFRSNIRSFLGKYACLPPPSSLFSPTSFPHLLTWQISFRIGDPDARDSSVVSLDIVEEDVTRSRSVYCDQCRVVGWSGHPVCGKRYHFIIRADNHSSIDGHHQTCTRCGTLFHSSDSRIAAYQQSVYPFCVSNSIASKARSASVHIVYLVVGRTGGISVRMRRTNLPAANDLLPCEHNKHCRKLYHRIWPA